MQAAAGCSRPWVRPHDPPPAVRAKQTACNVRGPARSRERHSRSSLKVQGRRSRGWAWRSLFVGSSPTGTIRCGGCQTSISAGFSALGLTYRLFWQGWLPALFDERVAELTGVGAAIPSFPFVEMQSGPEQPPPQGAIHQLVTVLASRLHMSVPEIVMAYALVS